jgi:hypothetical protein
VRLARYIRDVPSTPSNPPPDPAWQCIAPESLQGAHVGALDQFFLELFRRVAGGDLSTSVPVSTLQLARGEQFAIRRYGSPTVGLVRTERFIAEGPDEAQRKRLSVGWDIRGLAGIEVRGLIEPRENEPPRVRIPMELRDERTGMLLTAAWRQAFGVEPTLAPLQAPTRPGGKGPPFRCTHCREVLGSEPEDTRTCPRCLAQLDPARAIGGSEWGPLRAQLHEPGLHRLFSAFTRSMDTDVAVDIVFDGVPEGGDVPPCAGIAVGPMGATRALLLRPDGTFAMTRDQLIEQREPGRYPRERVMAVEWTEHPALGRGLGERNRIRAVVDENGVKGWLGEHLLFELPSADDDADGKCVCLIAACDGRGASVRFERFQVAGAPPLTP